MSLGSAIVGGIALKMLHDALADTEADHDDVLEEAYHTVEGAAEPGTDVYVDHINDRTGVDADGTTHNEVPNTTRVPDLVAKGFLDTNLIVEVETATTLDADAVEQLDDFTTKGYTRALIVPEGAVEDGIHFVDEELEGEVYVTEPSSLPELL
jgi:hypothetical protein